MELSIFFVKITAGSANNKAILTIKTVTGRMQGSINSHFLAKHYFLFRNILQKMRINAIPPIHMTRRISGVIWSIACIKAAIKSVFAAEI